MLNDEEFDAWARRVQLSDNAEAVISRVRSSQPARNVSNSAGNLCGTIASRKMRKTIQWESWTGERALVILWEHDPACLEMWDQPLSLKINYVLPSGRRSGARTVVDYLVLTKTSAGIVDYKTSAELRDLVVNEPYRWVQNGPNSWDQPPARAACESMGLGYRLLTDHDIPHLLLRNIDFLRPRLLRKVSVPADVAKDVREALSREPRLSLTAAIALSGNADFIYEGHFLGYWYLDLRGEALAHPDNAMIYADARAASLCQAIDRTKLLQFKPKPDPDQFNVGDIVVWGSERYQLANATKTHKFLQAPGRPLLQLSQADFRALVLSEQIISAKPAELAFESGLEILRSATPQAIDDALEKLKTLEQLFDGKDVSDLNSPRRSVYEWKARYREGEKVYGSGFIGLIDRHDKKGNRTPRTEEEELSALKKAFEWLRKQVPREIKAGYAVYLSFCEDDAITPRSYVSFNSAWNTEDQYEATVTREGKRAAYPLKPPRHTGGSHLDQGPPEGDSPFSLVHFDHVQSNIFCRRTNGISILGKPWISIAIDAFTRLVLAFWISILSPSHASNMMLLREIVRRHGRLPMMVITDSGKDFKATVIKQLLASKGSGQAFRPGSEPRFGIPVERLNLDIDHHLSKVVHGSNAVLRQPRNSSKSHDPRILAYLTLEQLAEKVEWLLYEHYPLRPHDGIQTTPDEKLRSASILQGTSWGIPVDFDEQLLFQTLAGPHKHGGLVRQRDGIRLNGHNYYSDILVGRGQIKLSDQPLYDPEDPTYIYARIDKRWEKCRMIDSQLRRLPPEANRRYYLGERIYLQKPGTKSEAEKFSLTSLGRFYRELDEELESQSSDERNVAGDADMAGEVNEESHSVMDDVATPPQPIIKPAPISRRSRAS